MTRSLHITAAAALLGAMAIPAFAADAPSAQSQMSAPAATQNNAQAGLNDVGQKPAPNMQVAANTTSGSVLSSEPSPTQRKATHSAAQRAKADAAEAETTRQLNMQANVLAKPDMPLR